MSGFTHMEWFANKKCRSITASRVNHEIQRNEFLIFANHEINPLSQCSKVVKAAQAISNLFNPNIDHMLNGRLFI